MTNSTIPAGSLDRTLVAYEVRTGAGTTLSFHRDVDDADEACLRGGRRSYVVFVENIGGRWVAQED